MFFHLHILCLISLLELEAIHGRGRGRWWTIELEWRRPRRHQKVVTLKDPRWRRDGSVGAVVVLFFVQDCTRVAIWRPIFIKEWTRSHTITVVVEALVFQFCGGVLLQGYHLFFHWSIAFSVLFFKSWFQFLDLTTKVKFKFHNNTLILAKRVFMS